MESTPPMPLKQKSMNILGVTGPLVAVGLAAYWLWGSYVSIRDIAILAVGYALTCLGVSIGLHRYLTHRSFKTYKPVAYSLAVLGSLAVQGNVIAWVADHRRHHAHSDREGDPHSPHGHGDGVMGVLKGLWHAHMGWLFTLRDRGTPERWAKDLLADRTMKRLSDRFDLWALLSLALPAAAGYLLTFEPKAAFTGFVWGGAVRVFLLHHVTFSINSICHMWGSRRFRVKDESRNVFWLALPSFGEAWHHNHHAFPSSAFHGLKPWEIDIAGLVIRLAEKVGLVWDVVRIPPEKQAAKAAF